MASRFHLILLLAIATLSACGGEPAEENGNEPEQAAEAAGAPAAVEESEEVVALPLSEQEAVLKPLELRPERYVTEISSEELERAYRDPRGEYIDPRRVIELLRQGEEAESREPAAEEQTAGTAEREEWEFDSEFNREAIRQFEAGDLAAAALSWSNLISGQQGLTISVEVDCDPRILKESFASLRTLEAPLFLIPVAVEGRGCYRLCLGLFGSREEAADWLSRIRSRLPEAVPFVLYISDN